MLNNVGTKLPLLTMYNQRRFRSVLNGIDTKSE